MNLLIGLLMSMTAQAQTADSIKTIMTCQRLKPIPDLGLSVKVTEGGFAGLTQVKVSQFFLGHTTTSTYIVRELPVPAKNLGAGVTYQGDDVTLHTNFTTAPNADGSHYGVLTIEEPGKPAETTELACTLK